MSESQVDTIVREHGRRVAVYVVTKGDRERTVVFCHAAPGSAAFDPDPEQTRARGVTLLSLDRPGYGQSEPVSGADWASVSAAADDMTAMLDQRGLGSVGVVGWSAGGRVALALAARRPELVDRVVVVATPAPHEAVPWIPDEQMAGLEQLRGLPAEQVHAALSQQLGALQPEGADMTSALPLLGVTPADDAALALPGARDRLERMLQAAFAQGVAGMVGDIAGYCLQPWGFEPGEVQAKTLLIYGSKDPVACSRHGTWWQKQLPNARLEVSPGAGHLVILPMWHRVLSFLAPRTKSK
ncbi:MAG: alpha/beta hydrolase [Chloroflexi bacterium]|nr:alpha/beta hydrolase [Chloroflexota bacterium]